MSCNLDHKYKFEQARPPVVWLLLSSSQEESSGCPFAVELVSWVVRLFSELVPFFVAREFSVGSFGKARS
jgi:hypothetical protein